MLHFDATLANRGRVRRWSHDADAPCTYAKTAHDSLEIACLFAGAVRYQLTNDALVVAGGQALVVPAGVEHASTFLHGMHVGAVHIDAGLVAEATQDGASEVESVHVVRHPSVLSLGRLIIDEISANELRCADALILALVAKVLPSREERARPVDRRVRRVLDYIRSCYNERIDVSMLAHVAGMSRFHFSRLFKAATGVGPYQYLLDVRLAEAARLLERGRPVTEAALEVGFEDLSRFAERFRRRYGAPPAIWAAMKARSSSSIMSLPFKS